MAGFMPAFNAGSAAIPATKVELSISCRNLVDMDVFSKSDPMVVLYIKEFGSQTFKEVGRTETINDNLNPDFAKKFIVDYFFEESQKLKFEVYDVDSASRNLREHDFLGSLECTLAQVVTEAVLRKPLQGPMKNSGAIIAVSSEEVSTCKEEVTLRFNAKKLDKKDFFGKSDPFLSFHKAMEDGSYILTYRTEVIKNTLNPTWRPFTVPVRLLCNGDYDRSIKIECWDWNSSGSHDYIGECLVTLRELSKGSSASNVFDCVNSAKQKKKKGYKNSGTIELMQCTIVQAYSFLDFVKGGMQLNCTIAIDFTASNGNPLTPTSLHYIAPYSPNQYTQALASVGEIIKDYDSDQLFPALGFGARLPPEGRVSHEFFLNGNPENPYCQGIDGVLAAYQQALHTVQLYGPTNFAPVINHVSR
ncbi:PREDICTED: copine-8-like [Priapulus caudatus]|uniref:Copine-8-like n=1 Tax=Priapulus caudatus TaxID=37621 RepID=A0ABM1ERM2_PRICU|nr:PREDICTED: copine-8-like [Priapulus caudatus]